MWTEILHLGEGDLIPVKSYHKYKLNQWKCINTGPLNLTGLSQAGSKKI